MARRPGACVSPIDARAIREPWGIDVKPCVAERRCQGEVTVLERSSWTAERNEQRSRRASRMRARAGEVAMDGTSTATAGAASGAREAGVVSRRRNDGAGKMRRERSGNKRRHLQESSKTSDDALKR